MLSKVEIFEKRRSVVSVWTAKTEPSENADSCNKICIAQFPCSLGAFLHICDVNNKMNYQNTFAFSTM